MSSILGFMYQLLNLFLFLISDLKSWDKGLIVVIVVDICFRYDGLQWTSVCVLSLFVMLLACCECVLCLKFIFSFSFFATICVHHFMDSFRFSSLSFKNVKQTRR